MGRLGWARSFTNSKKKVWFEKLPQRLLSNWQKYTWPAPDLGVWLELTVMCGFVSLSTMVRAGESLQTFLCNHLKIRKMSSRDITEPHPPRFPFRALVHLPLPFSSLSHYCFRLFPLGANVTEQGNRNLIVLLLVTSGKFHSTSHHVWKVLGTWERSCLGIYLLGERILKSGAILLLSFYPHSPAALAQAYLETEEWELDDKQQQALSWIEEPQREFLFQLYAEHLHKRTSWLFCLPFCCSPSLVYIGTNFRQTLVSLESVLLESFYVALTLGSRIVSSQHSIPDGPCSERCEGSASSAQSMLLPHFFWLCPFSLYPSTLSAFHLFFIFLHRWPGH